MIDSNSQDISRAIKAIFTSQIILLIMVIKILNS